MRIFCNAKDSLLFPTKNNGAFVMLSFEFNETVTNDVVNFEQPAPDLYFNIFCIDSIISLVSKAEIKFQVFHHLLLLHRLV